MKKRLLSLAIAICTVAAMLSMFAVSASAEDTPVSISYYFCTDATTQGVAKLSDATEYNEELGRYWIYKQAINNTQGGNSQLKTGRLNGDTRKVGAYIALGISVPESGTYKTEYSYYKMFSSSMSYGGKGDVYILPEGSELPIGGSAFSNAFVEAAGGIKIASVDYSPKDSSDSGIVETPVVAENVKLKKGNNVLVFVVTGKGEYASTGGNNDYYTTPTSLTLTLTEKAPAEDEELTNAFMPNDSVTAEDYNEPAVITITKEGVEGITSEPNGDGTYTVMAPAEKANGSKFLYWAKGLTAQKKILLNKTNELKDYLPDGEYANYLIPVYEDDITAPEYYNADGQFIPGANQETKVTMPGYGTSIGWNKYGDNIYVAEYQLDKPAKNITVTTTNCTTNEEIYGYGDLVICETVNPGEKIFKCWKKNGEIVSMDTTYSFYAWEDCTVEAVFVDSSFVYTGTKTKIIIDSFDVDDETGVMAEFIGFANAIEKGILFTKSGEEATKIAMTTTGGQFTVIADEVGTYEGYTIIKEDDNSYTLITDGLYEKE